MIKKLLGTIVVIAMFGGLFAGSVYADGCYICKGKSGSYVKFTGSDNYDKRKQAKACGCEVGGTTSSCNAANYTILCTVSFNSETDKSNLLAARYCENNSKSNFENKSHYKN